MKYITGEERPSGSFYILGRFQTSNCSGVNSVAGTTGRVKILIHFDLEPDVILSGFIVFLWQISILVQQDSLWICVQELLSWSGDWKQLICCNRENLPNINPWWVFLFTFHIPGNSIVKNESESYYWTSNVFAVCTYMIDLAITWIPFLVENHGQQTAITNPRKLWFTDSRWPRPYQPILKPSFPMSVRCMNIEKS